MRLFLYLMFATVAPIILIGCSSAPIYLKLHPVVASRHSSQHNSLPIKITKLSDQRDYKNSAGAATGAVVHIKNLMPWLNKNLNVLNVWDCRNKVTQKPLTLHVALRKLYIEDSQPDLIAVVALKVSYWRNHRLLARKYYRGQSESINWAGSHHEINSRFNHAILSTLRQMHRDICRFLIN